jgi:hypothetical protein
MGHLVINGKDEINYDYYDNSWIRSFVMYIHVNIVTVICYISVVYYFKNFNPHDVFKIVLAVLLYYSLVGSCRFWWGSKLNLNFTLGLVSFITLYEFITDSGIICTIVCTVILSYVAWVTKDVEYYKESIYNFSFLFFSMYSFNVARAIPEWVASPYVLLFNNWYGSSSYLEAVFILLAVFMVLICI